jgi:hypothetical protein
MPAAAYARVATGLPMPGIFVVSDRVSSGGVIDDLLLIDACCGQAEWDGLVLYLPLATARPWAERRDPEEYAFARLPVSFQFHHFSFRGSRPPSA